MNKFNDNITRTVLLVTFIVVLALTAAASVAGYFALTNDFDFAIFHYINGSVSVKLLGSLPWTALCVSLICGVLLRVKTNAVCEPKSGIPTVFASVFAGLLMAASAYFNLTDKTLSADPSLALRASNILRLPVLVSVFALLSCIYFVLSPFAKKGHALTALSFTPALWAAMSLLMEYFRSGNGEPINSDLRTSALAMYAFLLIFFAEEIRFRLGRQLTGLYYFCLFGALIFTAVCTLPRLAVILTGVSGFTFRFSEVALGTALFLLVLSRLADMKVTSSKN